jgi:hypothetical protein
MREIRQSGSEGGGTKPIVAPYPYNPLDILNRRRRDPAIVVIPSSRCDGEMFYVWSVP